MPGNISPVALAAYNDPSRQLVEHLIIEMRWFDQLESVSEFRKKLWAALLVANDDELNDAARSYADEVHAIRLANTTWVKERLTEEGVL